MGQFSSPFNGDWFISLKTESKLYDALLKFSSPFNGDWFISGKQEVKNRNVKWVFVSF